MLVHTSFYDLFFIVDLTSGRAVLQNFRIGNISVLSVAAGDAELNYPIQDTQEPGLMLCIV